MRNGKLTQALANQQTKAMEAAHTTLKWLARYETAIKAMIAKASVASE